MAAIVMGVVLLLGKDDADRELIFSTLGRVMSNTFNIMDSSYEKAVGLGVYGVPSLINHSCQPNSTVVFSDSTLILRCGLTLNPGDQVSLCDAHAYNFVAASTWKFDYCNKLAGECLVV